MFLLGCSPGIAVKHAWHDRFGNPESRAGSGIDLRWRFSMIVFVFGQLLQSVKIFGCQNIPLTQTLTAALFVVFVVTEVFRAFAGEAPEFELANTPPVGRAKTRFDMFQRIALVVGMMLQVGLWIWVFSAALPSSWFVEKERYFRAPNTQNGTVYVPIIGFMFLLLLVTIFYFAAVAFIVINIPETFATRFQSGVRELYHSIGQFVTTDEEDESENGIDVAAGFMIFGTYIFVLIVGFWNSSLLTTAWHSFLSQDS